MQFVVFAFIFCINLKKQTADIPYFLTIRIALFKALYLVTYTNTITKIIRTFF